MKFLIIILSVFIITQAVKLKENTKVLKINKICHEVKVLNDDIGEVRQLVIDYSTDTLYFSYKEVGDMFNVQHISAKYDLNTNELTNIEGISGFAQTVDPKTHDVYLGGEDGLYKYNKETNKAEFLGEKDSDIFSLFYKDTLYYTKFHSDQVYSYTNGQSTPVEELKDTKVTHFLIDDEDNMFYTNNTGVYSQKKGTKDVIQYAEVDDINGLTTDINGNVYVSLESGVYAVKKATKNLKRLFGTKFGNGVAFDKDNNIICSDWFRLYSLKPNKDLTC